MKRLKYVFLLVLCLLTACGRTEEAEAEVELKPLTVEVAGMRITAYLSSQDIGFDAAAPYEFAETTPEDGFEKTGFQVYSLSNTAEIYTFLISQHDIYRIAATRQSEGITSFHLVSLKGDDDYEYVYTYGTREETYHSNVSVFVAADEREYTLDIVASKPMYIVVDEEVRLAFERDETMVEFATIHITTVMNKDYPACTLDEEIPEEIKAEIW